MGRKQDGKAGKPGAADGLDRRHFLSGAALASVGAAAGGTLAVAAGGDGHRAGPAAAEVWLARFLTGKTDLPPDFVGRVVKALAADDPETPQRLALLHDRIRAAGLSGVEQFGTSPLAVEAETMALVVRFVAAFYLGAAGDNGKGAPTRNVSLEQALMYRPTADKTPIPTYARGGPGWWNANDTGGSYRE